MKSRRDLGRNEEAPDLLPAVTPDGWLPADLPPGARKLLVAALAVFAARGFHGATTREIAEVAGFSSGGLYAWFKSKADLLAEITRLGTEDALRYIESAAASATSPVDGLKEVTRSHVAWHARNHTLAQVTNYEIRSLPPARRQGIIALRRQYEGVISDAVKRALQATGIELGEPRMLVFAVLSLGIDSSRWFSPSGGLPADEVGAQYANLIALMVGQP